MEEPQRQPTDFSPRLRPALRLPQDCTRVSAQPRRTELAEFACEAHADGRQYTHLSDHYGIATTLRVENDVC